MLSEWDEFRSLDLVELRRHMHLPIVIDGRNMLDPAKAKAAGLEYVCMGRPLAHSGNQPKRGDTELHDEQQDDRGQSAVAM